MTKSSVSLIETDRFPLEFLSQLAERESWRKEIFRPIYHVHKWWATRLGSIFRGILLGCLLPEEADLVSEFYKHHELTSYVVFDPFSGSGTTLGEAHKLGLTALGRDINPVAIEASSVALGPLSKSEIQACFMELAQTVGQTLRGLYKSKDSSGRVCDVLYYFWVMQASCPSCQLPVDLFPSRVIARNAYPSRHAGIQVVCPSCGNIFASSSSQSSACCLECEEVFDPRTGPARGEQAYCPRCEEHFNILKAIAKKRPIFRLYGKLVLNMLGKKEYLAATVEDQTNYLECSRLLTYKLEKHEVDLPALTLAPGHNTKQAMNYGFLSWRDFFNDRQLLALEMLKKAIERIENTSARNALLTLFSGTLEFNNMFASYKGEGTGAVRHMFSHHILKPERTPIEANVWGTEKSSGSFSTLFHSRLLRALNYRMAPTEVTLLRAPPQVCSPPFAGLLGNWESLLQHEMPKERAIYLSCGDSSATGINDQTVDLVVTDPPFFDFVHYSELADFFYAWIQPSGIVAKSTRDPREVQDADVEGFELKLKAVFAECFRILKEDGILAFTYHHSRDDGWRAVIGAIHGAGFKVVNAQPVKSEMSVATPKSQTKDPIQLDCIIICRKQDYPAPLISVEEALLVARSKLQRLEAILRLSKNDKRLIVYGQLLTTIKSPEDKDLIRQLVESELVAHEQYSLWEPSESHLPSVRPKQLTFSLSD